MARIIPAKVRDAAVAAYLGQQGTLRQVALQHGLSPDSLSTYLAQYRQAHGLAPEGRRRGRAPTYTADELALLRRHALAHPETSLEALCVFMAEQTGKSVSRSTLAKQMRLLQVHRQPPPKPRKTAPSPAPRATRYTDTHRREIPGRYPSDLTDAEWALLAPSFPDKPGRQPEHGARRMLDAILYLLRSGGSWRMLPHDFPPWKSVYSTFRRWSSDGRLAAAHEALRRKLREQQGRAWGPSLLIVDSQSARTTEKGGLAATTQRSMSTVESDISE